MLITPNVFLGVDLEVSFGLRPNAQVRALQVALVRRKVMEVRGLSF